MSLPIYQTENISQIITYLQEKGLLNSEFRCHKCDCHMQLKDREAGDKKIQSIAVKHLNLFVAEVGLK